MENGPRLYVQTSGRGDFDVPINLVRVVRFDQGPGVLDDSSRGVRIHSRVPTPRRDVEQVINDAVNDGGSGVALSWRWGKLVNLTVHPPHREYSHHDQAKTGKYVSGARRHFDCWVTSPVCVKTSFRYALPELIAFNGIYTITRVFV